MCLECIGSKPTRNTFALRVTGDSMIGRHMIDCDIGVFEHGPEPRSDQIVAALIDRKNTLKTVLIKGGKPDLKAGNPKFPDPIPTEELVIQGVLRAVLRTLEKEGRMMSAENQTVCGLVTGHGRSMLGKCQRERRRGQLSRS